MKKKLCIGIAGSSGAIYAQRLLSKLVIYVERNELQVDYVMSDNALINWKLELGEDEPPVFPFTRYKQDDFYAPFASGSTLYDAMIICPCSMGVVGRIVSGVSGDVLTRAADVCLKEGRKLIVVPRETPLSRIHLRNLLQLSEAGGTIIPAIPSFYHRPKSVEEVVDTVVDRVLDHVGIHMDGTKRWQED